MIAVMNLRFLYKADIFFPNLRSISSQVGLYSMKLEKQSEVKESVRTDVETVLASHRDRISSAAVDGLLYIGKGRDCSSD